jgi:hypothetical protein
MGQQRQPPAKVGAQALQAVLHLLPHLCIQRRRRLDR